MTFTIRRSTLVGLTVLLVIAAGVVVVSQRANAASSTPVVYVATGENFPDALGAASAAAVQGGPVLLVQRDSIPQATRDELARLSPDVIVVAGGIAVVSQAVFDQLKAYAPSVVRAAGPNRYVTAVEVSKSAFPAAGGGSAALEARVAALEALLAGVSRNGTTLVFEGMNLQIVNGEGQTASFNSVGNVIIGYNEADTSGLTRTGSHYIVIGANHSYAHYAGIVSGYANTVSGANASVTGGFNNMASNASALVTGGAYNTASGLGAAVSGGSYNTASGSYASVSGGSYSTASGSHASVSGGYVNTAAGAYSSVLGGWSNVLESTADHDTIAGGDFIDFAGGAYGSGYSEGTWNPAD